MSALSSSEVESKAPEHWTLPEILPLAIKGEADALNHYLFRFPAKFHPPVVRALLEKYTRSGEVILDPFCGSGTSMVEAAVLGRSSIGIDIDPVAALVASVKVRRYQIPSLGRSADSLRQELQTYRRPDNEYLKHDRPDRDIGEDEYEVQLRQVRAFVPEIPNLLHWFRRYVIIDLARIRRVLDRVEIPETHRDFFRVVLASIIRKCSNADPVPVSGLEVTSWMKERDSNGRVINPFEEFESATVAALNAAKAYTDSADPATNHRVAQGDATKLSRHLANSPIDAVLTSPPYHGAVDYYRRHQLEMFWLGLTETVDDRLRLLGQYIGRPKVPQSHPLVKGQQLTTALAATWEKRIRDVSRKRADAFRHYMVAMSRFFESLAEHLRPARPALLVVGHSSWNEVKIPTTALFQEIAGASFDLEEVLSYPVKNRYMSYSRKNNADIDKEYVLVMRRSENYPS